MACNGSLDQKGADCSVIPLLTPAAPVKGSSFLVGNGQDPDFIQTD
jgi:hypothetical protein